MLDLKFIRENPDVVKRAAELKKIKVDVDKLLELDKQKRELLKQTEDIKAEKNRASEQIPKLHGENKEEILKRMKELTAKEKSLDEELKQIDEELNHLLLWVPQIPSEKCPPGNDEKDYKLIKTWGEPKKFDFEPLDHMTLGEKLDMIDTERGVKIAGSRNYFLKNAGVRLEMAILMFTLDTLAKKGFTPFSVPVLVEDKAMIGTGYFPGGEEQAYRIDKDKLNLIGTSEVAVTSYHADEILTEKDLPKKYAGISPCFRREAGTYGKDTRGLYRVHQFQKVEQVIICKADVAESQKMFDLILGNAEEVLQALELPYRVVAICTGEMGQGQVYKNDIETWMPSRKSYGETHSCSMFYDFQARRLNLRYKDAQGKTQFCHTLNNTCVASPRILIPVMEMYQNADGTINVPKVLQPYMNGVKKII
ncbi:MAG: seryl-tRNA synthetase, seryl-tRNA synthetase [Candidatus Peregrinibacteria bacterium GW2011_GWF2_38_29]|nr:MAG: seryl-tRNA synthetase, seryl-tRNA synthetase [Candidatus Peregrinibacteria bacterium GW2011_GWF2_38_29]HBB02749.1 serine--tRNA ligase [Candidatus Peregrinibacteria bacterium]